MVPSAPPYKSVGTMPLRKALSRFPMIPPAPPLKQSEYPFSLKLAEYLHKTGATGYLEIVSATSGATDH